MGVYTSRKAKLPRLGHRTSLHNGDAAHLITTRGRHRRAQRPWSEYWLIWALPDPSQLGLASLCQCGWHPHSGRVLKSERGDLVRARPRDSQSDPEGQVSPKHVPLVCPQGATLQFRGQSQDFQTLCPSGVVTVMPKQFRPTQWSLHISCKVAQFFCNLWDGIVGPSSLG